MKPTEIKRELLEQHAEIHRRLEVVRFAEPAALHGALVQLADALRVHNLREEELMTEAKELGAPYELVRWVAREGRLPVPNFAAGGVATPADAALMMQLGAEAIFVGSGVFKSSDPPARARAIVQATTHFRDPDILAKVSEELGEAMPGLEMSTLAEAERLQTRGW